MYFSDIIFCGWYLILDRTIYSSNKNRGIGPREHSFFVTFLFHAINFATVLRYAAAKFFTAKIPLAATLGSALLIFLFGYMIYFQKNRLQKIIPPMRTTVTQILFVTAALLYAILSVYVMLEAGDYVRARAN